MTSTYQDPVLVVIQATGGNDYMNTVVPYADPLYQDNRPTVGVPVDEVLPINERFGFNPALAPLKDLYDDGRVAVINGIGYPNPNRSHFRAMDIWHTCEPGTHRHRGLVGPGGPRPRPGGRERPHRSQLRSRAAPSPRPSRCPGGFRGRTGELRRLERHHQRGATGQGLDVFARMYAPAIGTGPTMDYLGQTGLDALKGPTSSSRPVTATLLRWSTPPRRSPRT